MRYRKNDGTSRPNRRRSGSDHQLAAQHRHRVPAEPHPVAIDARSNGTAAAIPRRPDRLVPARTIGRKPNHATHGIARRSARGEAHARPAIGTYRRAARSLAGDVARAGVLTDDPARPAAGDVAAADAPALHLALGPHGEPAARDVLARLPAPRSTFRLAPAEATAGQGAPLATPGVARRHVLAAVRACTRAVQPAVRAADARRDAAARGTRTVARGCRPALALLGRAGDFAALEPGHRATSAGERRQQQHTDRTDHSVGLLLLGRIRRARQLVALEHLPVQLEELALGLTRGAAELRLALATDPIRRQLVHERAVPRA